MSIEGIFARNLLKMGIVVKAPYGLTC